MAICECEWDAHFIPQTDWHEYRAEMKTTIMVDTGIATIPKCIECATHHTASAVLAEINRHTSRER